MIRSPLTCPLCKAATLRECSTTRTFSPNKICLEVSLLSMKCQSCGVEKSTSDQHKENLRRLAARKKDYGDRLMGEEYIALRKKFGLTQTQASRIFRKGLIAFSRYENESSYPDPTTSLLIELAIERPDVLKALADKAGVTIPLWKERCEDVARLSSL
jgi:putative zinc finger/helix-turn-helix YgiT family protein